MKVRFRIYSTLMICAFVMLASAPVSFAQKAKEGFKYVPEVVTKKTVPYVVNPNLSPAARRGAAAFSGAAVERALETATAAQGSALSTSAVRMKENLTAGADTKAPPSRLAEKPEFELPGLSAQLSAEFLTGPEALQIFRPGWRSELMLAGFTRQQLELVEQAFSETDQLLVELDENGNWLAAKGTEWEYSVWYAQILTDNAWGEMALNDGQIKTLFGKFSRLDDVFTRLNLQAFLLINKRAPNPSAPGEEGKLARHVAYNIDKRDGRKTNPEAEGYVYGRAKRVLAQNPSVRLSTPTPSYGPKGRAPQRTPDEVLEQVLQFIRDNDRFPSKHATDEAERSLRWAFDNACKKAEAQNLKDGTSQRLLALKEQWVREKADVKTPQEIYDYVTQFMHEHNGKWPSTTSTDPVEKAHASALQGFHNRRKNLSEEELEKLDEVSRNLEILCRENIKKIANAKTPQEMYDYVTKFMREHHGKLPSRYSKDPVEKSYAKAVYSFHYTRKNLSEEELDELDETSRALEKLCREKIKEVADAKTPQEIYDYVTQFIPEHKGKWPSAHSTDPVEKSYAKAVYSFHYTRKNLSEEELDELDEISRALEIFCRENIKEVADAKTPQEIYDYVTQFMPEHNGKLPSTISKDPVEKSHAVALYSFHKTRKNLSEEELNELDESSRALEKLCRENIKEISKTKMPQEIYDYVTQYMREHHGKLPSQTSTDPVEKSYAKALENFHSTRKNLNEEELGELDESSRALEKLCRENMRKYTKTSAEAVSED